VVAAPSAQRDTAAIAHNGGVNAPDHRPKDDVPRDDVPRDAMARGDSEARDAEARDAEARGDSPPSEGRQAAGDRRPAGQARRPRRPTTRASFDSVTGAPDPAERSALAHETAAAIVRLGRSKDDDELTTRLVGLADEVGLDALSELWRDSSAESLPGTLWALYLLRTWVRRSGREAARVYAAGRCAAEVADVVAGVAEPPGPQEMADLGDAVLTSVFDGDLAVALDRAAAFSRVVGAGRLALADDADEHGDDVEAARQTRLASGNIKMADQLSRAARLWRADTLR